MKTKWDYTKLADAYLKRPDYSEAAIDAMLAIAGVSKGAKVCDVGAGVAHLTLMLAARGMSVVAVEPNDAMRANGIKRTSLIGHVSWQEGTGEQTGQKNRAFSMVTFGSSFNVCDRPKALKEMARILIPQGWFACMWNHRSLVDPIQGKIESIIKNHIPDYGYGTRREDQTDVIESSRLFGPVIHLESRVLHEQTTEACLEAWRSHATLERQAGKKFEKIIGDIGKYLNSLKKDSINIPYSTQIWMAQLA
jgi:ubiquinone/menaquinone biosynthesis C-methylase UbiE